MSRSNALDSFSLLRSDDIVDALVNCDGQYNDPRMNVSLLLTAPVYGATVLNNVQVLVWKRIQME